MPVYGGDAPSQAYRELHSTATETIASRANQYPRSCAFKLTPTTPRAASHSFQRTDPVASAQSKASSQPYRENRATRPLSDRRYPLHGTAPLSHQSAHLPSHQSAPHQRSTPNHSTLTKYAIVIAIVIAPSKPAVPPLHPHTHTRPTISQQIPINPSTPHLQPRTQTHIPLLVASSSNAVSTAAPGKCTYRTTLPRIKTFLTDDYIRTHTAHLASAQARALVLSPSPPHPLLPRPALTACRKRGVGR